MVDADTSSPSSSTISSPSPPLKPEEPKRKKRRKTLAICVYNCRYDIVKKVAQKFGMKEVSETDNWNLYWTDLSISIERCKEMKRFQRINHFPGMLEICRKDLLARNLNRMLKLFPKDYNFFPKTWCLPADLGDALSYSRTRRNRTYILKPDAGSQGRGIFLTKTLKEIKPTERMICQVYISRPLLIDGFKFDLRVYTLITSCEPLRVYIYNEGLVRFATSRYHEPTNSNVTNVFMHLTNYAVNKHSKSYSINEGGSKRKFSWFNGHLRSLGHDVGRLWQRIDDLIIKTIFSAWPILRHSYMACFPQHDLVPACCELLGMDILVDRHLSPLLLEVNHSPSFHTDTTLDTEIKENLITDMFNMLNLEHCDKKKVLREDRRRVQNRLIHGHPKELDHFTPKIHFAEFHRNEISKRGGYRLVYPDPKTEQSYYKYAKQGQASIYSETACSNARQQAAVALREEVRAKEEAYKKLIPTPSRKPPEQLFPRPKTMQRSSSTCNSFEPQSIVQADETERLMQLAHRDLVVRSHGLTEYIYSILKRNGALRPSDERKYAKLKMKEVEANNASCKPTVWNFLDGHPPGGGDTQNYVLGKYSQLGTRNTAR